MSQNLPFKYVKIGQFFTLRNRVYIKTGKQYAKDFINNKSFRLANDEVCLSVK